MKFTVRMKTPDALCEAIEAAMDINDDNHLQLGEHMEDVANKWFLYGELVNLEIDTEAGTCTVLEW